MSNNLESNAATEENSQRSTSVSNSLNELKHLMFATDAETKEYNEKSLVVMKRLNSMFEICPEAIEKAVMSRSKEAILRDLEHLKREVPASVELPVFKAWEKIVAEMDEPDPQISKLQAAAKRRQQKLQDKKNKKNAKNDVTSKQSLVEYAEEILKLEEQQSSNSFLAKGLRSAIELMKSEKSDSEQAPPTKIASVSQEEKRMSVVLETSKKSEKASEVTLKTSKNPETSEIQKTSVPEVQKENQNDDLESFKTSESEESQRTLENSKSLDAPEVTHLTSEDSESSQVTKTLLEPEHSENQKTSENSESHDAPEVSTVSMSTQTESTVAEYLSLGCQTCFENLGISKKAEKEMRIAQSKANQYENQAMKAEQLETELAKMQLKYKNANEYREKERIEKEEALKLAKKNEEKAKKAENLEKKVKEMEREMKEMRRKLKKNDENVEKMEKLERKMESRKEVEDKLRQSKKEISIQKEQLEQENLQLKQQAEIDKNTIRQLQEEMKKMEGKIGRLASKSITLEQSNLLISGNLQSKQRQILESTRRIASLNTTNFNLISQISELQRENEALNSILSTRPSTVTHHMPVPSTSSTVPSSTVSQSTPTVPLDTGIPDTDCIICHEFRESHEETIGCEKCPRVYHLECLQTWYKQDEACGKCPSCKQPLTDPNEFPDLS